MPEITLLFYSAFLCAKRRRVVVCFFEGCLAFDTVSGDRPERHMRFARRVVPPGAALFLYSTTLLGNESEKLMPPEAANGRSPLIGG